MSDNNFAKFYNLKHYVNSLTILDRNRLVMFCGYNNEEFSKPQNSEIRKVAKAHLDMLMCQLNNAITHGDSTIADKVDKVIDEIAEESFKRVLENSNINDKVDKLMDMNKNYIESVDVSHLFNNIEGW